MNNNHSATTLQNRIVWADLLRLIAIFMVISIHCSDPFNVSAEARSNPEYNFWGSIYGAFLRPCVPLFVMLTGMLLLPVQQTIGQFYKKRMLRIVTPFLIWSLLYNLFPWFTGVMGWESDLISKMFPYAGENPSQQWGDSWHNILMIPFHFTVYTVPMWYIYMLIGLYLYMPIFSAWVKQSTDKQRLTFLGIWVLTLFLPYYYAFVNNQLFGTCAWNSFGTLYYFAGFNGYLLLGYHLSKGNTWSVGKTSLLAIPLFAIGYIVTYLGFKTVTANPHVTEEQMELFFLYCSPNVFLMTLAVFLLVQKVKINTPLAIHTLSNITKCGLGIYMIHYFIVGVGYLIIDAISVPVSLRIPTTAILVFALSWGIVACVYKLFPKVSRWIFGT